MEFGAIAPKKRVSSPKGVCCKNYISGSQGRWTLGFCMEAAQGLKSLYHHWCGLKPTKSIFNTPALGAHEKWGKWPKCQYWEIYTHGTSKSI